MSTPTAFTELVGCAVPVQLAPMGGGVGTPELAAAVCAAGGLGMISSFGSEPLATQLAYLRTHAAEPFGVGFFAFAVDAVAGDLEAAAEACRVVDIFWGDPDAGLVSRIHAGGALAFWQVGTRDDALAAADAGCDAVVVQGVEAGGHVRGTEPLLDLLEQTCAALTVPVVAAGGISTGKHVRRVFESGASAVRVGTRLLATIESAAHADYLAALVAARDGATELTTAFHVGWEDAPHRVLREAILAARTAEEPIAWLEAGGHRTPVRHWSAMPPTLSCTGQIAAMAMYAGTGVADIAGVLSVADAIELLLRVE
jgi:NAD(P)H-dependent flavin oxidoreductase YrpB (nitropropane dioxygenase family)